MNTNNVTELIPGINHLPPKWQGYALIFLALSPYVTRAYHAIAAGGGIRGVLSAIWLGTNTPKSKDEKAQ